MNPNPIINIPSFDLHASSINNERSSDVKIDSRSKISDCNFNRLVNSIIVYIKLLLEHKKTFTGEIEYIPQKNPLEHEEVEENENDDNDEYDYFDNPQGDKLTCTANKEILELLNEKDEYSKNILYYPEALRSYIISAVFKSNPQALTDVINTLKIDVGHLREIGVNFGNSEIEHPHRINIINIALYNDYAREKFLEENMLYSRRRYSYKRSFDPQTMALDFKRHSNSYGETIIDNDNTNAFVITNFLNPSECDNIINTATPFLAPLDHLYEQRTRKADRAMIKSATVANQIYKRLLPHLNKERDYANRTPLCFGHDGVWVPLGLNECIKVFRYSAGGQFVPHRDGPWVPQRDQCSMYTVIIYLNDDFTGGQTSLMGSDDMCSPQGCRTTGDIDFCYILPIKGMALIVNHDCWHAGLPVAKSQKGVSYKWILRTELIFQRVHTFYIDRNYFANDNEYKEVRALYDSSMEDSVLGNRNAFFEKYQRVVKLQRNAMLREEASKKDRLLKTIGIDEISHILSFLQAKEIRIIMHLNRRTYISIVQAPYWQDRWRQEVGRLSSEVRHLTDSSMLQNLRFYKNSLGYSDACKDKENTNVCNHQDYFGLFKDLQWRKFYHTPISVILLESGSLIVTATPEPTHFNHASEYRYGNAYRPTATILPPLLKQDLYAIDRAQHTAFVNHPDFFKFDLSHYEMRAKELANCASGKSETDSSNISVLENYIVSSKDITFEERRKAMTRACNIARGYTINRCETYYGSWFQAYPYHMNQPEGERFPTSDEKGGDVDPRDAKHVVNPDSGKVAWCVLCAPIENATETINCPVLVVTHPTWPTNNEPNCEKIKREHYDEAINALFGLTRSPAVAFCHPAVCAFYGLLSEYGIEWMRNHAHENNSRYALENSLSYKPEELQCIHIELWYGFPEHNLTSPQPPTLEEFRAGLKNVVRYNFCIPIEEPHNFTGGRLKSGKQKSSFILMNCRTDSTFPLRNFRNTTDDNIKRYATRKKKLLFDLNPSISNTDPSLTQTLHHDELSQILNCDCEDIILARRLIAFENKDFEEKNKQNQSFEAIVLPISEILARGSQNLINHPRVLDEFIYRF